MTFDPPPDANAPDGARAATAEALRRYWDRDARTYDDWAEHGADSAGERAAWAAALTRLLPAPDVRLLDVGAGTGFLSLAASRLGHRVTALDISPAMLARLRESAAREGLGLDTVCAPAEQPPSGTYDVVMERLALWTLPDPTAALTAWRRSAPGGRLLAFESLWTGRDYGEGLRRRGRKLLHRWRRLAPEHHAPYQAALRESLPLIAAPTPDRFIELIEGSGWRGVELVRLRDVEWARELALSPLDRLLGVTPEYVITARAD